MHPLTARARSSVGSEHLVYTQGVRGSNPFAPTSYKTCFFFETGFLCYGGFGLFFINRNFIENAFVMRTSVRFEQAIRKLYTAFHSNTLNPECCKQCAVGNILDNTDAWKNLSDYHGSLQLNYVGKVHETLGRKFKGYTPQEILKIEAAFLKGCGYQLPLHYASKSEVNCKDKEVLFQGLCSVVATLCKMDGMDNVMDYTRLFTVEKEKLVSVS